MWCSRAWAAARDVAWPAEGVSRNSRPIAAAKTRTMAARILAILKASRNRLLARVGYGFVRSRSSSSSYGAERRAPSTLNCPAPLSVRGTNRYDPHAYNERDNPGHAPDILTSYPACIGYARRRAWLGARFPGGPALALS